MKMRRIDKLCALTLALCLILPLAACGGTSSGETSAPSDPAVSADTATAPDGALIGKTDIVFANASDIASADPHVVSDTTSIVLLKHIYCTLLDLDNEGNLCPDLAVSYEASDDAMEFVFKLNENAIFADGTPITAQDVKFSFERAMEMPQVKSLLNKLDSVTVDNDHQVTFKLKEPYALFSYIVSNGRLAILSEEAVTTAGDAYGDVDTILSSGEYVMSEWAANDHYTLVRNENYWGEMPITTSITCRVVPEGTARSIMLETGEVDLVYSVDAVDVATLSANSDVTLLQGLSSSVEVIGMNLNNEYLQDVRVRQAISHAINKQEIVDVVMEGNAVVANSVLNKTIPGWSEEVQDLPYDVERARELMKEAGYEDGFTISIYFFGTTRNRIAQMVQAMLAEININLDINAVEGSALLERVAQGEHDLYNISSGNSNFNADYTFYNNFHSDNIGSSNYIFLDDPDMDDKIEEIQRVLDEEVRNEEYRELQQYIMDEAYMIPLYYRISTVGINSQLKGFSIASSEVYSLKNCYYEQ